MTATTTITTATSAMTNKVFDSVELVLMLLSMYSCVTRDVRTTVMFLLEIVFGYEPTTRRFGRAPTVHEVTTLFEPLSALALFHQAEYKLEHIKTKADALEMVVAILRPILIRLTPAEFAEIHKKADDAVEIMIYTPLSEVQDLAARWAADARSHVKLRDWMEWSRTYMPAGESDIRPVDVPKAGAIAAQFLYGESAAAPATCSLRRTERVEKRRREDVGPLDSNPRKRRAPKDPLPTRPCPVHVMVTSPTALEISGSSSSLDSLAMDLQPFIRSHRGVRRNPGEWIERGTLDGFKFPVRSMDVEDEPTASLEASDNQSIVDLDLDLDSEIAGEETTAMAISRTTPELSTLAVESDMQRSRSAPQLTYAARTRTPSELAASGTLATLSTFVSVQAGSANWRAFSISSGLSECTDSDISDWSLRMQWLEHEDDSLAMSRGGSMANLSDISYHSFQFPRPGSSSGSSSPSTGSESPVSTPTVSTPATSLESLFEEWATEWQSDQLTHWKSAIHTHNASESQQEALVAQYADWADEWQDCELESWTHGLADEEVQLCLDRKTGRVEIRRPSDNTAMNLARKIGRALGL